jgi:hypothetical protein
MTRSRNTLLVAAITFSSAIVGISTTEAGCHGSRGYSRGYSSHNYHRHHHNYGYASPSYGYAQPQPIHAVRPIQPVQPVQQQFVQPQPVVQQQLAPQQQQISVQQPIAPVQQQTAPQQQAAPIRQQVAPQQQAPAQQSQAPANAQTSALQALGGFAPPQPAQVQTPAHVGNWTASLGNGANVRLVLQADGSFSWSATNKAGNASTFQGSYAVGNGSLTLTRGTDNQRLAGSMTTSGSNAFNFKLTGNNAAGINFTRS